MEASAIKHSRVGRGARPRTALVRMQSDERLVVLVRRGSHVAFGVLVDRYQVRLLAFCRHMLRSREDAEDVLQEVFASAYKAMIADQRPIIVRPWLYRIARNRCLNHLRKFSAVGVESIEEHLKLHQPSASEAVAAREELFQLVQDIQALPEQQRAALLLRELESLTYDQIAEVLDKTIPSVKSLLIRARRALAERAEARSLSCAQAASELAQLSDGEIQALSRPVRWHLEQCVHCGRRAQMRAARTVSRRSTGARLAALAPLAPLALARRVALWLGSSRAGSGAGAAGLSSGTAGAALGSGALSGGGGILSAGLGGVAVKAAAGLAAAAIGVAGAVTVGSDSHASTHGRPARLAAAQTTTVAPAVSEAVRAAASSMRAAARAAGGGQQRSRESASRATASKARPADRPPAAASAPGAGGQPDGKGRADAGSPASSASGSPAAGSAAAGQGGSSSGGAGLPAGPLGPVEAQAASVGGSGSVAGGSGSGAAGGSASGAAGGSASGAAGGSASGAAGGSQAPAGNLSSASDSGSADSGGAGLPAAIGMR